MEIKDYPSGSKSAKKKKEIAPVVHGGVEVKKKSEVSKIKDKVVHEDLPKVKDHILFDILIPNIKRILADSFNTILFGESGYRSRDNRRSTEKVSYRKYYDEPRERERATTIRRGSTAFQYDYIVFDNRAEAYSVLDGMRQTIERYGEVSISDMYDLSGISCPYSYADYGWIINTRNDLTDARVIPDGSGYSLRLSPPVQLDK